MVHCPVIAQAPPDDVPALEAAARRLETYEWAIFASRRAVAAVARARRAAWPRGLRTAAVGASTARALVAAGADPPPVVGDDAGAVALWHALKHADSWAGRHVLVPTAPGGRRDLIEQLTRAGALVDAIDAYRTVPRAPELVAVAWTAARPDAAVLASPSAVSALAGALGTGRLRELAAIVAIGPTTAGALKELGVATSVPSRAGFREAARCLADAWRRHRARGGATAAACYASNGSE